MVFLPSCLLAMNAYQSVLWILQRPTHKWTHLLLLFYVRLVHLYIFFLLIFMVYIVHKYINLFIVILNHNFFWYNFNSWIKIGHRVTQFTTALSFNSMKRKELFFIFLDFQFVCCVYEMKKLHAIFVVVAFKRTLIRIHMWWLFVHVFVEHVNTHLY